jgi:signal transduction histidine kinase/DNA-binding NarL/FixJ family response regulator
MTSVLIVDDQPEFLDMAKRLMEKDGGIEVQTSGSAEEALELLKNRAFDVVISDYLMEGMDGLEFLRFLREHGNDVPVIIYASQYKDTAALSAVRGGAEFFFQKSVDPVSQFTELKYVVEEIAKRKAAEDTLQKREKDFHAIVDKNADAMMVLDRNGFIQYTNPAATTLFNMPQSELCGKMLGFPVVLKEPVEMYVIRGYMEFVAAEMRMVEVEWGGEPSYLISFRDVTGHVRYEEELNDMRDDLEKQVTLRTSELRDVNDKLKMEVETRRSTEEELRIEIEERKVAEENLRQEIQRRSAIEKALEEAKVQSEVYLDLMGHDINNLNQIGIGYLELAMESSDLNEVKSMIEKPLEVMRSASRIIDNVRKLKQIGPGGHATVAMKTVNLCDVLAELKERYTHVNNRDITIDLQCTSPCLLKADELLTDVFSNLLDNAVKHSDPIKPLNVNIKVDRVREKNTDFYLCTVEDNGPGVPDWIKDKIFMRFQRGSTKAHGKGLGLYLIKKLVEGYHGVVWVEDRIPGVYNKGAKFMVMLPAA